MFDSLWGLINIVTLERFAPSGNTVSPYIYQGASQRDELCQIASVLLTAQFVWTLSQLWKSLRGSLFRRGLALKSRVMLGLPLAVRRVKQCEGSLSISETGSNSCTREIRLGQISVLTSAFPPAWRLERCCSGIKNMGPKFYINKTEHLTDKWGYFLCMIAPLRLPLM